jgi:hypothetical protein
LNNISSYSGSRWIRALSNPHVGEELLGLKEEEGKGQGKMKKRKPMARVTRVRGAARVTVLREDTPGGGVTTAKNNTNKQSKINISNVGL